MVDWKKIADEADQAALKGAVKEVQPKFRLLPGDPKKGTRYTGIIRKVDIDVVSNQNVENYGRQMISVTVMVTDNGAYNGYTEIFTRVPQPVSIDLPNQELVEQKMKEVLAGGNMSETEASDEVVRRWKTYRHNFRKQTYEWFSKLGVDITSGDDAIIIQNLSNAVNNPVIFTIYDKDGDQGRRKFLEYPAVKDDEYNHAHSAAPPLLANLPNGAELPLD